MNITHVLTEAKVMEEGIGRWVLELQFSKVIHRRLFTPFLLRPLPYQASLPLFQGLCYMLWGLVIQISFVPWDGNKVVHGLVQYARNLSKFSS